MSSNKKKPNIVKINVGIHSGLYDRIKALSAVTGQSYASLIQTSVAIGVGQLEPSILGTFNKSSETNEASLEVLRELVKIIDDGVQNGVKYEQQELKLD